MHHLPLLPSYGPATKVRSSVVTLSHMHHLSHTPQVEDGYMSSYFVSGRLHEHGFSHDGYIVRSLTCSPPAD